MDLYHVTRASFLPEIVRIGLNSGSYWASLSEVSDYYAEVVGDELGEDDSAEDDSVVVLMIQLDELEALAKGQKQSLQPDWPGLEEPLTYTLNQKKDEINKRWKSSHKTWRDCLNIIGSLRCPVLIPAESMTVRKDGELEWARLNDFARVSSETARRGESERA